MPDTAMPESIVLEVTMLSGNVVLPETHFSASALVSSVKEEVRAVGGIAVQRQRLLWQMVALEDSACLGDLSLPSEGAALQLAVVLPPQESVAQARQLVQEASAALNSISLRDLAELKSLNRPPGGVDLVLEAVMHLQAGIHPGIKLNSRGAVKDTSWQASQTLMKQPKQFFSALQDCKTLIDNGGFPERNIHSASRLCESMGDFFSPEVMRKKSAAACGLCKWVLSTIQYHAIVTQLRAGFEGFDILAEIFNEGQ